MSKKNILITVLALLLAVALIGTTVYIFHNNKEDVTNTDNEKPEENAEPANALAFETVKTDGVMLAFAALEAPETASAKYLSTQVTATVLPADAPDKTVDWSVEWAGDATRLGSDISEYVTVEPASDGSTTATVYCHKPFTGDTIYVKVTTRTGGFTAIANCYYVGHPQTLSVDKTGYTSVADPDWNTSIVEVDCNKTYRFNLKLDNVLGSVGDKFGNYKLGVETHGGMNVAIKTFDRNGNQTGTSSAVYDLSAADTWDSNGQVYSYFTKSGGMHVVISCTIENGQLVVEAKDAMTAYYAHPAGPSGSAEHTFGSFVDGMTPYTTITITDTVSGLSTSINIRTLTAVSGVSVNGGNNIEF